MCSLSARTSVIAAANPVGGHYNRYVSVIFAPSRMVICSVMLAAVGNTGLFMSPILTCVSAKFTRLSSEPPAEPKRSMKT